MKPSEYREKAEKMLSKLDTVSNHEQQTELGSISYSKLEELGRDFLHLVYAFDKELPMYNEISSLFDSFREYVLHGFYNKEEDNDFISKYRYFINYFTKYVREFCE